MCASPGCTTKPEPRIIRTNVPDAKPVMLTVCPTCDSAKCKHCQQPIGRTAVACPKGHRLL